MSDKPKRIAPAWTIWTLVGALCIALGGLFTSAIAFDKAADASEQRAAAEAKLEEATDVLYGFQQSVYERCQERAVFDQQANDARAVQVREWRALATMEQDRERQAAYVRMADATERAVDAAVSSSCERYAPQRIGLTDLDEALRYVRSHAE